MPTFGKGLIQTTEAAAWMFRGEWPSGLRRYIEKDPGSNPTTCSVGLWDPTSLPSQPR